MPAVNNNNSNVRGGSAAKKKNATLAGVLSHMHWDTALALVMASDPYYHYTPAEERHKQAHHHKQQQQQQQGQQKEQSASLSPSQGEEKGEDAPQPPTSTAPREHWFRRYLLSSSKTRLCVHLGAVGYLAYVATHPSRYVPCHVEVAAPPTPSSSSAGSLTASVADSRSLPISSEDCYLYQGAEGMQLLMRGPMPKWAVFFHAVAGSLLLPLAITQKESVFYMPFARKAVTGSENAVEEEEGEAHRRSTEAAQAQSEAKKIHLRRARTSRRHHGNCGFMTGACVVVMVAGGVSLRSYSVFSSPATSERAGILNFASAMFLFAAPWMVLTPATTASGGQAKAAAHAMLGGVLIKAILAVPFERVLGGVWQKLAGVHVALPAKPSWRSWLMSFATSADARGSQVTDGAATATTTTTAVRISQSVEGELERVYYKSILITTVVFGLWGVVDIVRFVRLAQKCVVTDEHAKTSS